MFQSLIGTLQTVRQTFETIAESMFQSLIGTLQTVTDNTKTVV